MRTLLIETPQEALTITSKNPSIEVYNGDLERLTIEEVANDIKKRYSEDTGVYIINANVCICGSNYIDNSGIRLLKLLRLNHINSHVALYSQWSRDTLLSEIDIRNAIVYSKGVSYHHVLNIRDLSQIDFTWLERSTADPKELLLLFRAEYDPKDRHFNANMFGVWQLMRVQEAYEAMLKENQVAQNQVQPQRIQEKQTVLQAKVEKYLNSYNGLLVQYIMRQGDVNVQEALRKAAAERKKNACCEIIQRTTEDIKTVTRELEDLCLQTNAIKSLLDGCETKAKENRDEIELLPEVLELFDKVDERAEKRFNARVEQKINEYCQKKAELELELQRLTELKEQVEQNANTEASPTMLSTTAVLTEGRVADVHKALNECAPQVVYVDDMADEGWSNVLCRIIYDNPNDYSKFRYVVPEENDDTTTIVKKIFYAFSQLDKNVDLLILDLRLKKNERGFVHPKMLSGFKVLQELNDTNLSCPILIFTASNKIWSMKEAFKGNVMSYWTKGNLEQLDDENVYIDNYLDLVEQINSLTEIRRVFGHLYNLRKIAKDIDKAKDRFWWEYHETEFEYRDNDNTRIFHRKLTKKEVVIDNLKFVVESTQNYLRQMYFQSRNITILDVYRMMIIQLSYIVEEVLRCQESIEDLLTISYKIGVCLPQFEKWKLTSLRNSAAHRRSTQITDYQINGYIYGIMQFLFWKISDASDNNTQTSNYETGTVTCQERNDFGQKEADGRQLTPVEERLKKLESDKEIKVEVVDINTLSYPEHTAYLFDFYILKEDKQQIRSAVLLSDDEGDKKYIGKIKIGDVIDVKRVKTKTKYRLKITGYHKASEFFEKTSNDMLTPDQVCEQEMNNEIESIKEEET